MLFRKRRQNARRSPRHRQRGNYCRRLWAEALEDRRLLANDIGHEFRINSETSLDQLYPALASDDAGDFVMTWSSFGQDGSGHGVYAQRYDANGNALGGEFQVNTFTGNDQLYPSVASDDDGNFVMTWSSFGQDGSGFGVYAQRYDADGIPQGGEFRVNTYTINDQLHPSITCDDDGNFVIAWMSAQQDGSDFGVYARRYDANGNALGAEFQVNTHTISTQSHPTVTSDGVGNYVIAWMSFFQDGSDWGVYARRFDANGNAISGEFLVNTVSNNDQRYPSLAGDDAGNFVITWSSHPQDGSGFGVYGRRYDANGNALGGEFQVNTFTGNHQLYSSVASDDAGNFVITWSSDQQDGSGSGMYGQRYDADGSPSGGEFQVNTHASGSQTTEGWTGANHVAMDEAGNFVVAWQSHGQDGWGAGVYAKRFGFAPPRVVSATADGVGVVPGSIVSHVRELKIRFNRVFATSGPSDVTAPASWRLELNGLDVSSQIAEITASSANGQTEAVLELDPPVTSGTVELTLLGSVKDLTGQLLDGNGDGVEGDDFTVSFDVAAPTPLGNEFQVNTHANNHQQYPAVAMDHAGNYVVAWSSHVQDGHGYGVYAQRYAFNGTPLGGEFQVNTYTSHDQLHPSVASDDDGNFVITWASLHQDGSDWGIYAQRYAADGARLGNEFRVNTYTNSVQQYPSVASDEAGNFLISWVSFGQDGSSYGVYAQRYAADGSALGEEFRVNSYTSRDQLHPSVTSDAAGNYVIAWSSELQDGSGQGVYAQRYAVDGTALGGEFQVNTFAGSDQFVPSVASDAAGNFVIVWSSRNQDGSGWGVYGQRYAANGAALGGEFQVNTYTAGDQSYPSVASDDAGNLVIIWPSNNQDGSELGVYGRRYDADGNPESGEFQVNTYTNLYQTTEGWTGGNHVAIDQNGKFVVIWQSFGQDIQDWGVYGQRFAFQSTAITQPEDLAGAVAGLPPGVTQVEASATPENLAGFIDAVEALAPNSSGELIEILIDLAEGSYGGASIDVPQGYRVVISGESGDVVFEGASPSLVVNSGEVLVTSGVTFVNSTAASTIVVNGGSLTLRGSVIRETTGGFRAAIEVNGGSLDLGDLDGPGGNKLALSGAGDFLRNRTTNPIPVFGNTFQIGTSTLVTDIVVDGGKRLVFNSTTGQLGLAPAFNTVANPAVSVDEGSLVTNSGTVTDVDLNGVVTLSASRGIAVVRGDGTWSWSYNAGDELDTNVTITAQDDHGGEASISFALTVNNVAPIISAGAVETVEEGAKFTSAGSFTDPGADTWSATVDYGDGSGVQPLALNGNKTFSLGHTYADDGVYTVTYTVTDDDGGIHSDVATVNVRNVEPAVTASNAPVTVSEGAAAHLTGLWSDPGDDLVTLTASIGTIIRNGNGTWSWSFVTSDGPAQSQTVTITATDSDEASSSTTFQLTVNNVAPSIVNAGDVTVSEGSTATNSGSWSDPGTEVVTLTASVGTVTRNDDGTWSWSYPTNDGPDDSRTVTITATDSDGASSSTAFQLTVNNVAPAANPGGTYLTFEDVPITLNGTGTDAAGGLDSLTFEWDLDNNDSFETAGASVIFNPAALGFTGSQTRTVRLRATDEDGAENIATTTVQILGQGITQVGGVVYVVSGPTTNDVVTITRSGNNIRVVATFNSSKPVNFAESTVTDLYVRTRGGNDVVNAGTIAKPMTIDGGTGNDVLNGGTIRNTIIGDAGNDVLNGGVGDDILLGGAGNDALNGADGNDVLSGGDGNDSLIGSSGRDLLIGGQGNDSLSSGTDEDILVGATTLHDSSVAALDAIMAVWKSPLDYESRVATLTAADGPLRAGATIFDDDDPDSINGGTGRDVIFGDTSKLDKVMDSIALESALDTLFAVV
jgi:hypothetical protein